MAKTAFSYIRFSRPEQLRGRSLERQRELSAAWCERNGYVLDVSLSLEDKGLSGYHGDNVTKGKLGAFLELCEKGKIKKGSVLIVESLDRLSRQQVLIAVRLFLTIIEYGIRIVTVEPEEVFDEERLNRDAYSLIIVVVILSRAYEESSIKASRLKDSWEKKRELMRDGTPVRSRRPSWIILNSTTQQFELHPTKASTIKRICELYLDGLGVMSIARKFNEEGIKTIGLGKQKAEKWGRTTIQRILRDRALIGEHQPRLGKHNQVQGKRVKIGNPIPGYYPKLVSEGEFYEIQTRLDQRRTGGRVGKRAGNVTNLFQGLIHDARDGSTINIVDKGTKGSGKQVVSSAARAKVKGTSYVAFPYDHVEHGILTMMKTITPQEIAPIDVPDDLKDRLDILQGQLGQYQNQLSHIQSKLDATDDLDLIDTLTPKAVNLRKQIRSDKAAMETLASDLRNVMPSVDDCRSLVEIIRSANGEECDSNRRRFREVFRSLVAKIDILTLVEGHWRMAYLCLSFHNGRKRLVVLTCHRAMLVVGGAIDQEIDLTKKSTQKRLAAAFANLKSRSVKETEQNINTYIMERCVLNKPGSGEITDKLWIHID